MYLDDGRVDEQSLAVIVAAAEQVSVFVCFCGVDVFCREVEGVTVDDGAHQDAEVLHITDADGSYFGKQFFFDLRPELCRDVGAGEGGAFFDQMFFFACFYIINSLQ